MILSLILIALLLFGFVRGTQRGLTSELLSLVATMLSAAIGLYGYQWLAGWLSHALTLSIGPADSFAVLNNWLTSDIESPIFGAIAFTLIYGLVSLIFRAALFFIRPFRVIMHAAGRSTGRRFRHFIAGLLALIMSYFSLQVLLTMLALLPIAPLQTLIGTSNVARFMILETPLTSTGLLELFISHTHL